MAASEAFRFKQFEIKQDKTTMKVNTDGILLGAWSKVEKKRNALDIGTGTGLIALMLAQKDSNLNIKAIEIEDQAHLQAKENFSNSVFASQLDIYFGSIQDFASETNERYDLIISNPPFFSGGTFSNNENKTNVRHTVKLSHSDLLTSVKKLISNDGHFDIVLPYLEGLRFVEMAEKYDLYHHNVLEVIPKPGKPIERLLMRFGLDKLETIQKSQLTVYIGDVANEYTEDYTVLTNPYYLFM